MKRHWRLIGPALRKLNRNTNQTSFHLKSPGKEKTRKTKKHLGKES